ncbi:prepilin peptidase [Aquihabitans sp. G128]|uniref:prepilin peptidase n=1 Tax=Aquihabitans sp. G128 TaxID=2849779 RepID=UPI001C23C81C|nr:prepilin peptidase [Aquihabitans sp. G128]QXC61866.1 prepilin peptidase [Aquihabitans sp. G128]
MPTPLLLVLLALFGLVIGSFLNVVIVRVPSDESILRPPSKCPQCEAAIAPPGQHPGPVVAAAAGPVPVVR